MSHETTTQSQDPTHAAWLERARPGAETAVAQLWRPDQRAAVLWRTPRKLDRKGRLTAGIETKQSRLRDFDDVRAQIAKLIADSAPDAAKRLVAGSEFGDAVRLAFTREEAVVAFAAFLIGGDNAWADSEVGSGVLSICFWRD